MPELQRFDQEYDCHRIRVTTLRADEDSKWTVRVNVRTPEGTELPTISDDDHSYPTLEEASAAGFELGRFAISRR